MKPVKVNTTIELSQEEAQTLINTLVAKAEALGEWRRGKSFRLSFPFEGRQHVAALDYQLDGTYQVYIGREEEVSLRDVLEN
jgi:hypothetical protein